MYNDDGTNLLRCVAVLRLVCLDGAVFYVSVGPQSEKYRSTFNKSLILILCGSII